MPRRGDDFAGQNYVPAMSDVVHLNWSPAAGREILGPHYGLVLSADLIDQATGYVVVAPIASKTGKLSGFELPLTAGRVREAVVLSSLRSLDYQARSVQFKDKADPTAVATITRARAACFWRLLRSATIASRRTRSCGVTEITMPALIHKARGGVPVQGIL